MDTAVTLTAKVGAVLSGSGLREAPRRPSGHPAGEGYLAEPMPQPGPARAAVRWHHAGPCPGPCDGCDGLDQCRAALTAAGYRVETVHATVTYIAVLPPPGT